MGGVFQHGQLLLLNITILRFPDSFPPQETARFFYRFSCPVRLTLPLFLSYHIYRRDFVIPDAQGSPGRSLSAAVKECL